METSPEINNIATALKDFQQKGVTVSKDGTNPHFGSKFTSLDNIIETIRAPLGECGLSFAQFPDADGLTTILMHTSGEWMKATANLHLAKEDPQGQGSGYTYGRRYALSAMLGLAADEDDDADRATRPSQSRQEARSTTKSSGATKQQALELKAAKDRTITLLKMLGKDELKTKKDYQDAVFDLTGLQLTDATVDEVNEKLAALVEKDDAQE